MDLSGKTALITGGASGLGRGAAEALRERGANIVIVDLETSDGETVAKELGASIFAPADVTNPDAVAAAVARGVEEFGGIHVCVNCAGIGWAQRIVDRNGPHDLDVFTKVVTINLIGTFNVSRIAAAQMMTQDEFDGERGVIINTASIAAFDGQIGQAAYSASKGGVVGMTLPIARDLAKQLIRVCTIAPGTMNTPMLSLLPQEQRDALAAGIPNPSRLGEPSEFGALARHIAENAYLNGETIRLDGALRMPPR